MSGAVEVEDCRIWWRKKWAEVLHRMETQTDGAAHRHVPQKSENRSPADRGFDLFLDMDDANTSLSSQSSAAPSLGNLTGRYGAPMSPFFAFDPAVINPGANDAQWIFPDGATNRSSRGRFELAFGQIGTSVMAGGAIGGVIGGVNGFTSTKASAAGPVSWPVVRSQMLNFISRNGSNTANAFGTVAVVYSALGVALSFVNETHDELNTLISGTVTGLLYRGLSEGKVAAVGKKMQSRIHRSAVGALFGFALSAAYILLSDKDKLYRRLASK